MKAEITFQTNVTVPARGHNEADLIANGEAQVRKQFGSKPLLVESIEIEEIKGLERVNLHAALVEIDGARVHLHELPDDPQYAQLYKRLTEVADEINGLLFGTKRP